MGQMRIQRWMRLVRNLRRDSTTFRVTPSGLENGPNVTGPHLVTGFSTEEPGGGRPAVAAECNDCNEILEAARREAATVRRLAFVADNAIANGDLARARAALRDLQDAMASQGSLGRREGTRGLRDI